MPTAVGPNTKGEENLVFGYDLGDTRNSFKNPPSTNLVHVDVARGTTSGWDGYSVHTGFNLVNNGNGPKDGRPDTVSVTWLGSADRTGDWYPRFNLRNPDGSAVTTTGGEVFYASWEYKYEGEQYLVSSVPDFTTENFYGNGWKLGTHGSITTLRTEELPFGWKRRTARIVAGDSGTTQTPLYRFGSGYKRASGGDFTLWLDNIIITRDHPTKRWYPGQTSVSSTQGLRDLKRNSTIDLTNASFDSDAQMTFDGSSDHIDLGTALNSYGSVSIELVFKTSTSSDMEMLLSWGTPNSSNYSGIGIGNWAGGIPDESLGVVSNGQTLQMWVKNGHTAYKDDNYHHAIVTLHPGQNRVFVDGIEQTMYYQYGSINTDAGAFTISNNQVSIGKYVYNSGSRLNGKLPLIKIYNRALTASEIKSNFNAIKGRFNI